MSHDHGKRCACVSDHHPEPLELHEHHVLPLYLGGADEPTNRVWVCPTTHANIHELTRIMLSFGRLTWGEVLATYTQSVSRYAFRLAHEALDRYEALRT